MRLAMATEALVQRLLRMVDDETVPPAVRLAAIRDALDRANVVGTQEVAITATVKPWEETMRSRIVKVYRSAESDDDVIDAEVVDDSDMDKTRDWSEREPERKAEPIVRKARPRPAGAATPKPQTVTPDWYAEPPTRATDAEWAEAGRAAARRSPSPSRKRKPGQGHR